jgi:hypothetical protein
VDNESVLSLDDEKLGKLNLEIQSMNTHREVWLSLLKALPTVIIVTAVALMTSVVYSTGDSSLGGIAVRVSLITFLSTSFLWALALAAVWGSDKAVVDKQRDADTIRAKNERLRATAQEMFVRYKNWMPGGLMRVRAGNLRFDDGILEAPVTDWRTMISPIRQKDMEYLDKNLVDEMDRLLRVSKSFIDAFNEFAAIAFEIAKTVEGQGINENDLRELPRSVVYALYRFNVEADLDVDSGGPLEERFYRILREECRPYLSDKITWDIVRIKNLQKALGTQQFKQKAKGTSTALENLIALYNKILVEIRYKYSAET